MKVTQTSTTSTAALPVRIPGATLGPRPACPPRGHLLADQPGPDFHTARSRYTREQQEAMYTAQPPTWVHIPTARPAAGSYTRAQLDAAIAKAEQDEPRIPAPRKPYDDIVLRYGEHAANGCF